MIDSSLDESDGKNGRKTGGKAIQLEMDYHDSFESWNDHESDFRGFYVNDCLICKSSFMFFLNQICFISFYWLIALARDSRQKLIVLKN